MIALTALAALAAYAGYAASAFLLRNRVVHPLAGMPLGAHRAWPYPGAEIVEFESAEGPQRGYHLRADDPRGRVVLFHGNMMVAPDVAYLAAVWRGLGMDVLVPEYRGYGGQGGRPTPEALVSDTLRLVAACRDPGGTLVLHGISLGGGVAAECVRHLRPDALVLQSTFLSVSAVAARRFGLPGAAVGNLYPTARNLAGFPGRALVVHSSGDPLLPAWNGRALAALLGGRLVEVEGDRHMVHDLAAGAAIEGNAEWIISGRGN